MKNPVVIIIICGWFISLNFSVAIANCIRRMLNCSAYKHEDTSDNLKKMRVAESKLKLF